MMLQLEAACSFTQHHLPSFRCFPALPIFPLLMNPAVNFNHRATTQEAKALTPMLAGFLCSPKAYKPDETLAMLESLQILCQL